METSPQYSRPAFDQALHAWTMLLAQRGLPTHLVWLLDENLCFENDPTAPGGFRLGYQIAFTPPPLNAERIAFDYFSDTESRLVFYRLGSARGKSICAMLCDPWLETKGEAEGFVRRNDWLMSFRPGGPEEVPEVTDEQRWKHRIIRDRPLHELDFCMTLQAVREMQAHGRVLSAYERYALRFLHAWRRLLGQHG